MLLLRRLPLAPRLCACRGLLDPPGDHRAACATSGARALPLERAVARVCQEAGAQVARNVRLAGMNLPVPVPDARRIEIVCNGLRMELSLLLTPPVSAPSLAPASRGPALTVSRASPFCKQRGESVAAIIPSYRARRDATSSYSLLRLVAAGVPSLPPS